MPTDISRSTLPELLKLVNDVPAKDRVAHLREIANLKPELKTVLAFTFHRDIKFDLPEGTPPFKELDIPNNWGYNRLPKELKKFGYFEKGAKNNLTQVRREKIFIEILESVSVDEAKLAIMIKDKKLSAYKGITRKVVEEALPELFVGESQA
jgi:hypothetical protein